MAHDYGCLMAIVQEPLRTRIVDWVLEEVLEPSLTEEGRELRPHITVKYGFIDPARKVLPLLKSLLRGLGSLPVRLSSVSLFEGGKDGDVLKIDVESPALTKVNREVSLMFDCHDSHPTY